MESKLVIAVICGTKREGRLSINAANWVAEQGRQRTDAEIIFVDPKDYSLPPDGAPEDGEDNSYKAITAKADAFFIVTPEYNHSYPSSLKRLLDSEYGNYKHKAAVVAGVSSGMWGGVRACEALLPVCHKLGLVNIQTELYFPKIQEIFDEQGTMLPERVDFYIKSVQSMYDELIWMARALRNARENRSA